MKRIVSSLVFLGILASAQAQAQNKVIRHTMRSEPPTLDTTKMTDVESGMIAGHTMEGLMRYHPTKTDGTMVLGAAEKYEQKDLTYTFTIRKDAKWSDGKPVTAKDFVFAWRKVLEPANASEYAFILFPIKGAEAINGGKAKPETLGAVAVNDTTLTVTLERPTHYFLSLLGFATYMPIREDHYNKYKDRYAAEAENMLYNGPFKITKWVHSSSITLDKNPHYWNAKNIKVDRIDIPYITPDNTAKFNLFKDKKVDILTPLGKDDIPRAQKEGFKISSNVETTVWFLEFNFRAGNQMRNKNLRKALELVFNTDRPGYTSRVIGIPGTRSAVSLIPSRVKGTTRGFNEEYKPMTVKGDLAKAKSMLELARKELGGTIKPIAMLTGDTPLADREGQYFQSLFKEKLGLDIRLDKQTFKQRIAKMQAGEFDIAVAGWGADYPYAMTFADLMTSWNENNRGKWENAEYDKLIRQAQSTPSQKEALDLMAKGQEIVREELPILPTYEVTTAWTHHSNISGVVRRSFGPDPDLTFATVK